MDVAIIDCGSGNLRSVAKAFEKVVAAQRLPARVRVVTDAEELARASHIVLPGVGAFAACMRGLEGLPGMIGALEKEALSRGKPFLGICVGMQLMMERGFEHGEHKGLGWLKGDVVPLQPEGSLKVPHMGWNDLRLRGSHPITAGIAAGAHAYFVHSYRVRLAEEVDCAGEVEYGESICAAVGKGNLAGTQFHPEKSQETGQRLLANFLRMGNA